MDDELRDELQAIRARLDEITGAIGQLRGLIVLLYRLQGRPVIEGGSATEKQIIDDVLSEYLAAAASGAALDPALVARAYRGLRDSGEVEEAERHRRTLHDMAAAGAEEAAAVLDLLSDDPWWRDLPPVDDEE